MAPIDYENFHPHLCTISISLCNFSRNIRVYTAKSLVTIKHGGSKSLGSDILLSYHCDHHSDNENGHYSSLRPISSDGPYINIDVGTTALSRRPFDLVCGRGEDVHRHVFCINDLPVVDAIRKSAKQYNGIKLLLTKFSLSQIIAMANPNIVQHDLVWNVLDIAIDILKVAFKGYEEGFRRKDLAFLGHLHKKRLESSKLEDCILLGIWIYHRDHGYNHVEPSFWYENIRRLTTIPHLDLNISISELNGSNEDGNYDGGVRI